MGGKEAENDVIQLWWMVALVRNMGGKEAENDVIQLWWMVALVENLRVEGLRLTVVRASISRSETQTL
jgi:hypothetical protein